MRNFLWNFFRRRSDSYVGFGFVSGWKDGEVRVLARLVESPAGRAGMQRGDVLLEYNDESMQFSHDADYLAVWERLRPITIGDYARIIACRGTEQLTFKMYAGLIEDPIPVYPPLPNLTDAERQNQHVGFEYCPLTGEWFATGSLSDSAVDGVLCRR